MIRIQSHPHIKAHQIIHRKVFDHQNNVIIFTVPLRNAFLGSDNVINFDSLRIKYFQIQKSDLQLPIIQIITLDFMPIGKTVKRLQISPLLPKIVFTYQLHWYQHHFHRHQ